MYSSKQGNGTKDNLEEQPSFSKISKVEQRTPVILGQNKEDSIYTDSLYLDTFSEAHFHHHKTLSDSSNKQNRNKSRLDQSVLSSVRCDFNERNHTANAFIVRQIPMLNVNFETKKEIVYRSPKTINVGESEKEIEYNLKTLTTGRSQNQLLQTYMSTNPNEGSSLEQPMISFPRLDSEETKEATKRKVIFIHDETGKEEEKKDEIEKNNKYKRNKEDGIKSKSKVIKNDLETIGDYLKKGNKSYNDKEKIKKLIKTINTGYNPYDGDEGGLFTMSRTMIEGKKENKLNDDSTSPRTKKLSNILSKKKLTNISTIQYNTDTKTFDRKTLNESTIGKNKLNIYEKSPHRRFLYVSLAMMSSKGPNCEDRVILRRMRFDKGGVVDLAQEMKKKKDKFEIKKMKRITFNTKNNCNPKYREKAAKIIQSWWRDLKERCNKIISFITLIQSVWRGRNVRKYIYDVIYQSCLHQKLSELIYKIYVHRYRHDFWDKLILQKPKGKDYLRKLIEKMNPRLTALRLKPYFEKWKKAAKFLNKRGLKTKRLVMKRKKNEKSLKLLSQYFNEFLLATWIKRYKEQAHSGETNNNKIPGLFKLINGTESVYKKNQFKKIVPPMKVYLSKMIRNKALKKLLLQNPRYRLLLLRQYYNRWKDIIAKMLQLQLREALFGGMCRRIASRIQQNNVRRIFNYWMRMKKKEPNSEGVSLLERYVFRKTYRYPLKAFHEKINEDRKRQCLLLLLNRKGKDIKEQKRIALYQLRLKAQKRKDQSLYQRLYKALINTILNKRRKRLLSNKLNQWKSLPKEKIKDNTRINLLLKRILITLSTKRKDNLSCCFHKWIYNANKIKLQEDADIIGQFCKKKLKSRKPTKKKDGEREKALKKALDAINRRYDIINRERELDFLNRLKSKNDTANKFKKLGETLTKGKKNLDNTNENHLLRKIYRIFIYKKIDKMFEKIIELDKEAKIKNSRYFFDLLNDGKEQQFCSLYKAYSQKKMLNPKKELIAAMKNKNENIESKGKNMMKAFILFRKNYINSICQTMNKCYYLSNISYLIRLTMLHKKIAQQRFIKEVIQKWRFISFVKKMAKKKLKLMYKNLHVSYLDLANQIFGEEDELNPLLIKEFQKYGNDIGMFSYDDNSLNDESSSLFPTVKKKYLFNNTKTTKEETKTTEEIIEETDKDTNIPKKEEPTIEENNNRPIQQGGNKKKKYRKKK